MRIEITKLEYNEDSVPPFMVTYNDSRLMFPTEALADRIGVHDLEHEKAAVEHLIKETIQRVSPDETDFEFVWASHVDTSILDIQTTTTTTKDFSHLY